MACSKSVKLVRQCPIWNQVSAAYPTAAATVAAATERLVELRAGQAFPWNPVRRSEQAWSVRITPPQPETGGLPHWGVLVYRSSEGGLQLAGSASTEPDGAAGPSGGIEHGGHGPHTLQVCGEGADGARCRRQNRSSSRATTCCCAGSLLKPRRAISSRYFS